MTTDPNPPLRREPPPMMACGHAANAVRNMPDGSTTPCCVICVGSPTAEQIVTAPDLTGRMARCAYNCGKESPSNVGLAFFEYRGPGAKGLRCQRCGFTEVAHQDPSPATGKRGCSADHTFVAKVEETDQYYCGCWGWD